MYGSVLLNPSLISSEVDAQGNRSSKSWAIHPASRGIHRPVVESIFSADIKAASPAMKKRTTELGNILVKMGETYRRKKSMVLF
jgi:hypothetical protein